MTTLRITPEAADDLERLWDLAARGSVEAATRLLHEFWAAADRLLEHPETGHFHPDLPPGYRLINVRGRSMVVRRTDAEDDTADVIRVLGRSVGVSAVPWTKPTGLVSPLAPR